MTVDEMTAETAPPLPAYEAPAVIRATPVTEPLIGNPIIILSPSRAY
jgi:hypothetical protein